MADELTGWLHLQAFMRVDLVVILEPRRDELLKNKDPQGPRSFLLTVHQLVSCRFSEARPRGSLTSGYHVPASEVQVNPIG
jgi:hypothetical protein